ncbi:hypothetical protein [Xenorhabdus anantnagensis]|uniref:Uncharacterized protein n=1 Tax=Xenorhabdus anantnagensis TaxID=3025875 RepID=A0ABT5LUI0_9GAMM|nr:hypothetical protein [Xenorhabdus anantnagensis]MDC9598059.1 hypothetical protein [Xenorhabdus anantnagensis]
MKHTLLLKLLNFFCILTLSFTILSINKVAAMGGYLSFNPPPNIPSQLDELNFFFRMIKNPGPLSFMYYAHTFAINSDTSESKLTGYIGPQSNGGNDNNRRTLAIATVWYNRSDRLISYSASSESSCHTEHGGPESRTGWLIQCLINDDSKLAQTDMSDGTTYRISVKNIHQKNLSVGVERFEFSIQNLVTNKKTVLGIMTFANVKGISPSGPANFLENFGGIYNCQTIPYIAYGEDAPIGIRNNKKYAYTIAKNPDGPFSCNSNVTFSENHLSAVVEHAIKGEVQSHSGM